MKYISVYPRRGSPFWYVAYPDPVSGERVCKATEFRRDAPQSKRRAWNFARGLAADGPLLKAEKADSGWMWVEPWLLLRYRTQQSSLRNALNWWSWIFMYLQEQNVAGPRGLTREIGLSYIDWRMKQEKRSGKLPSYNSALQDLKFLSRVMREARLRDPSVGNPLDRLGLRKEKPAEKPEISDAEVIMIRERLAQIEGQLPISERCMTIQFEIALHQGCRVEETVMPMDRFDLVNDTVRFHIKGDRWGTVPLHPDLKPLIVELKASGAKVTCTPQPQYVRVWSRFFKGRDERNVEPFLPHLTFHCTRVTVVTRMARAGIPQALAMSYVLHADELVHKIYQRLRPADARVCHAALRFPPRAAAGDAAPQNSDDSPARSSAAGAM